jgi:hypothetical protein
LEKDPTAGTDDALLDIYRKLRPGEPPTKESAQTLLENLYFNPKRYDLAKVGRYKINKKLGLDTGIGQGTLTDADVLDAVCYDGNAVDDQFWTQVRHLAPHALPLSLEALRTPPGELFPAERWDVTLSILVEAMRHARVERLAAGALSTSVPLRKSVKSSSAVMTITALLTLASGRFRPARNQQVPSGASVGVAAEGPGVAGGDHVAGVGVVSLA